MRIEVIFLWNEKLFFIIKNSKLKINGFAKHCAKITIFNKYYKFITDLLQIFHGKRSHRSELLKKHLSILNGATFL
jgi:hypothetical protein